MDKQNVIVLRKILYAVESGDQVYGRQDYSCFAGAGANCDNEIAITIGAGQWYADEAKELLYRIQRAQPEAVQGYRQCRDGIRPPDEELGYIRRNSGICERKMYCGHHQHRPWKEVSG
ncbi:MAG: hypothetical protein ACLU5B_00355 [Mediterraneibacter faecis]